MVDLWKLMHEERPIREAGDENVCILVVCSTGQLDATLLLHQVT
jgi:hypothetical protein